MKNTAMAIAMTAALLGGSVVAQQTTGKPEQKSGQMSMDDMMKGCREHCQTNTKSMDAMDKAMGDAAASNDAAKMRAALTDAQKQLGEMRKHMSMCMNMMNMMEKMHGGMKKQ